MTAGMTAKEGVSRVSSGSSTGNVLKIQSVNTGSRTEQLGTDKDRDHESLSMNKQ